MIICRRLSSDTYNIKIYHDICTQQQQVYSGKTYLISAVILFSIGLIYYFFNPAHNDIFPGCVFKKVTGWDCPGCGSQRAAHELLHFNFSTAFSYNALFTISVPYVLVGLLINLPVLKNRCQHIRTILYGWNAVLVITVITVLFFIFRNL